ncbi:MAG: DinB family protein, partial [Acidimicrobiales bacterium]
TKDWTWVLERPCDECGFNAKDYPHDSYGSTIRAHAQQWVEVLGRPDVRDRPREDKWSALEYGCHVRDVHRTMDGRLRRMLDEDDPVFPNWDQDETALEERYEFQEPEVVGGELLEAATRHADRFDSVEDSQWTRPGTRSNGSRFTVETIGAYGLHDVEHHLWDVGSAN